MLEIATWINAEEAGAFFGQHAILVFVLVLAALFATGICLRCLLAQLESRVSHFAPADDQRVRDSANLGTFRDRFFHPFANVEYGPSLDDHLGLYLTISLFVLTVTSGSFLVLALAIGQQDWLVRFDHSLAASLYEHSTVNAVRLFQLVSVFGDASTLAYTSAIFVIALVIIRDWRLLFSGRLRSPEWDLKSVSKSHSSTAETAAAEALDRRIGLELSQRSRDVLAGNLRIVGVLHLLFANQSCGSPIFWPFNDPACFRHWI